MSLFQAVSCRFPLHEPEETAPGNSFHRTTGVFFVGRLRVGVFGPCVVHDAVLLPRAPFEAVDSEHCLNRHQGRLEMCTIVGWIGPPRLALAEELVPDVRFNISRAKREKQI